MCDVCFEEVCVCKWRGCLLRKRAAQVYEHRIFLRVGCGGICEYGAVVLNCEIGRFFSDQL